MSFCSKCGTALDADSSFCTECGAPAGKLPAATNTQKVAEAQHSCGTVSDSLKSDPTEVLKDAASSVVQSFESASSTIKNAHALEKLSNALVNPAFFVIGYTVFLIPTYILPYLGSNSSVINALGAASGAGLNPVLYFHIAALAVLVLISWLRGKLINKAWLGALPFAAAMFDLLPGLSLIPMVPTVLHVVAIVLGIKEDAKR